MRPHPKDKSFIYSSGKDVTGEVKSKSNRHNAEKNQSYNINPVVNDRYCGCNFHLKIALFNP
jgi:hypothetical protein